MIKIHNLNKTFEDRLLFNNFNLDIPDGSFVVINGESGSGKTTLINMIGGIEPVDSGKIIVDGIDITRRINKKKYYKNIVGFLFQNFALLENKTVRQNLELIQKTGRSEIKIDEALDRVGLGNSAEKKVYKLSGGEQQRIALARLMVKKCSLILADEPTGSLDKKNSDMVMEILHDLNREGKTVIMVTHDMTIVKEENFVIHI
ncbi:MAG: ATP-binding cassette domain-containing protein [Eubacterium sp.]|nr:ATP-binding cassette domain-containing protein [Eubacterium sp.]